MSHRRYDYLAISEVEYVSSYEVAYLAHRVVAKVRFSLGMYGKSSPVITIQTPSMLTENWGDEDIDIEQKYRMKLLEDRLFDDIMEQVGYDVFNEVLELKSMPYDFVGDDYVGVRF